MEDAGRRDPLFRATSMKVGPGVNPEWYPEASGSVCGGTWEAEQAAVGLREGFLEKTRQGALRFCEHLGRGPWEGREEGDVGSPDVLVGRRGHVCEALVPVLSSARAFHEAMSRSLRASVCQVLGVTK